MALTWPGRSGPTSNDWRTAQEWLYSRSGVQMFEVGSVNLRLQTTESQRRILRAEAELFNGLRFPLQRIALPSPLDLGEYLDAMHEQGAADPNPQRGGFLMEKEQHLSALIRDRHLVQWRNIVVVPIEEEDEEDRVQYIRTGLERLGLPVAQLDDAATWQVLYEILNPDQAAIDQVGQGRRPGVLDRIAPYMGLDFRPHQWFRVGTKWCRVLAVRDFPRTVTLENFLELYRTDHRAVVVQHMHPSDSAAMQRELSNSIGELTTRLDGTLSEFERESLRARLRDARRLVRKLAGEGHQVLDLCCYVLIRADSVEELGSVTRQVTSRFEGKGLRLRPCHFWQHQDALRCCLPFAVNPLREITRRNIPSVSVSAVFPYANVELSHGSGISYGVNKDTGNLVIVDPWQLINPHSSFIGTSGSGKTFTLNQQVIQFWSRGIRVLSLDIEGDKGRLCQSLKGQRVRIAPHAGNYLNPMEVRRPPLDPTLFLESEAEEPANGLAATIQRQKTLFSLLLPEISRVELARAEELLSQCYAQFGITYETYATHVGQPDAWPTWGDLLPLLAGDAETQTLTAVLQSWVRGSLSGMFDRQTRVNLDNQYVVLDLHDIMGDRYARVPVFYQAMTFLWDEINRDWRESKIMDIDELGILADSEDALEFVWRVSKCARRRMCRLQVATQDPADFLSGRNQAAQKYAVGIINNCATKVFGYMEQKALDQVAQLARLSEAEVDLLSRMAREEKLVVCGEQRAHVEVVASPAELRILDPGAEGDRKPAGVD